MNLNALITALPEMPNLARGACLSVDPGLFFDSHTEHAAKQVCRRCPVLKACLDYAVRCGEKHGVWGGTTEAERRPLLEGQPPVRTKGPGCVAPAHGSRGMYSKGCRCEPCRKANAEYARRRRLLPV